MDTHRAGTRSLLSATAEGQAHELTLYSKNSVTSAVEPLSVMAWFVRVACLVAISNLSSR